MNLLERIESERAEIEGAARIAARHGMMTSATRLQGKADGIKWVLQQFEIREQEISELCAKTEVEMLVKGGAR